MLACIYLFTFIFPHCLRACVGAQKVHPSQLLTCCRIFASWCFHPCAPFGGRGQTSLTPLLSHIPTPRLILAGLPHICAKCENSWLRVQVQVHQTADSSAIKLCCETDNHADRQPRFIGSTPCSMLPHTPSLDNQHILSFDSKLSQKKFAL